MAERKAVNKYIPPDFNPKIHGSVNKYQSNRVQKFKDGIPVIRFELPFTVWCLSCSSMLKKGKRFYAQKSNVGKYFTTTIYEFSMICSSCHSPFKISTDPENRTYKCVSGVKAKESGEVEGLLIYDEEKSFELQSDAMKRKEHEVISESKYLKECVPELREMKRKRDESFRDDFLTNKGMRKNFRDLKKIKIMENNRLEKIYGKSYVKRREKEINDYSLDEEEEGEEENPKRKIAEMSFENRVRKKIEKPLKKEISERNIFDNSNAKKDKALKSEIRKTLKRNRSGNEEKTVNSLFNLISVKKKKRKKSREKKKRSII